MPPEETEAAPRWALCSDCFFEGQRTCVSEPTCWHPMTIADLAKEPENQEPQVWVRPGHEDAPKYRMYRRAAVARVAGRDENKPTQPWMVQHFIDNPTHTVKASIAEPPHCVTCGDKSPAWDLKKTTVEIGPLE